MITHFGQASQLVRMLMRDPGNAAQKIGACIACRFITDYCGTLDNAPNDSQRWVSIRFKSGSRLGACFLKRKAAHRLMLCYIQRMPVIFMLVINLAARYSHS
jgi:hypothetical protein